LLVFELVERGLAVVEELAFCATVIDEATRTTERTRMSLLYITASTTKNVGELRIR